MFPSDTLPSLPSKQSATKPIFSFYKMPAEFSMLKNAPLKEVIFELHWKLDLDPQTKNLIDVGFDEAVLKFKTAAEQAGYQYAEVIYSGLPSAVLANRVTHRFRMQQGGYPVYQFGPGVFTINNNDRNYSWQEFQQMIHAGLDWLRLSYTKTLVPSKIELRYIDAIDWAIFGDDNKFNFLREQLNVNAESWPFVAGELVDINFSKRFLMRDDAYLTITLATGRDEATDEDLVVWHTFINNKQNISWEGLREWTEAAHADCSETFKKMVSLKLYDYFNE